MVEPYIWQFNRLGENGRKKSPAKLFTETDIYSVPLPDGQRDLTLEHGFQQLEDMFTRIRRLRLEKKKTITPDDAFVLHLFVATARARTASYRDFHRNQFGGLREKLEDFSIDYKSATEEEKQAMRRASSFSVGNGERLSISDIKKMEDFPIQGMLAPTLRAVLPIFEKMSMAILCTNDNIGFITSDNPVTWFDPDAYRLPPLQRSPGLIYKNIEVTLPLTPNQCLLLSHHQEVSGYIDIPNDALDEINRRHIQHCDEVFISRKNLLREFWFQKTPLPEDAWERRHSDAS